MFSLFFFVVFLFWLGRHFLLTSSLEEERLSSLKKKSLFMTRWQKRGQRKHKFWWHKDRWAHLSRCQRKSRWCAAGIAGSDFSPNASKLCFITGDIFPITNQSGSSSFSCTLQFGDLHFYVRENFFVTSSLPQRKIASVVSLEVLPFLPFGATVLLLWLLQLVQITEFSGTNMWFWVTDAKRRKGQFFFFFFFMQSSLFSAKPLIVCGWFFLFFFHLIPVVFTFYT